MRLDKPIPRDKVVGLVMLIAITFAVLSVVTLGPARARLDRPAAPAAPHPPARTHQVSPKH